MHVVSVHNEGMHKTSTMLPKVYRQLAELLITVIFIHSVDGVTVDSEGTEFFLALLKQRTPEQTIIQIGSNDTTHMTIEAPFIGLTQTYQVNPGVTEVVVDAALRESGPEISFKGIHLQADKPVSVYVIDGTPPDVGGYLALPVSSLGTEYIVASYKPKTNSDILITTSKARTAITVTLKTKTNVTYNGVIYYNGEIIRETLDTFQTWQIQSSSDLTGTIVKADAKIAVFSGSECATVPSTSTTCGFIVEQLPTVTTWKTEFIVPLVNQCENIVRILSRDDGTTVRVTHNNQKWETILNSTDFVDREYNVQNSSYVVIETTHPVLVTLLTGPGTTGSSSSACGASMAIIPALSQFANNYHLKPFNNVDSKMHVIVPSNEIAGIHINGTAVVPESKMLVSIGAKQYYVFKLSLSSEHKLDYHLTHASGVTFGVFVHGGVNGQAFSLPLGLTMDLKVGNNLVRLIGGQADVKGLLEVFHEGNWGSVCDMNFGDEEANVVCRILGFNFGSAAPIVLSGANFGQSQGRVMVQNLQCDGFENDLHLCKSDPWESSTCSHSRDVAVDCGTPVRLYGTNNSHEGRVEFFYKGQWGSVCDDNFGRREASVVCSSLGYGSMGYFYTGGGGTGPQLFDDVQCTGKEHDLAQCMVKSWGVTDCTHAEDVWVACYSPTVIRLANGRTPAEGRLEIRANNHWDTVCDHLFDPIDAGVVCSMLGYKREGTTVNVYKGAYFGQGNGPVLIDELNCTGAEKDIADCPSRSWLVNSCSHNQDVGVKCGSAIRLVDGPTSKSGRLEVYYMGHWGTVCDDSFENVDAQVVCTQLGFPYGAGQNPIKPSASFGKGSGRTVVDELNCFGNETDIAQCYSNQWHVSDCSHSEDVAIDCGSSIRLVGGSSNTEGRVEVFYQGSWGTICSDRFDVLDANVICDSLGYKFGIPRKVYTGAHYGQGTGQIIIDELQCNGNERDLQFCVSSPWLTHDCTHAQDIGVDCGLEMTQVFHVQCSPFGWYIQVDMRIMARLYPNSDASDIIFGFNGCKGTMIGNTLLFAYGLHDCNTQETTMSSSIDYTNRLIYAYHDQINPIIIRNYNWTATVNCQLMRNGSVVVDIIASHGNSTISEDTSSTYSVQQAFYSDKNYQNLLSSHPLTLSVNSEVFVKIFTPNADSNTKMIVQSCYATSTNNTHDAFNLQLIRERCSADSSVHILNSNNHETRFSFQMFLFDNSQSHGLYIHCDTKFCPITDYSKECTQVCRT